MVITVVNKYGKPLYVELVGTSTKGRKVILASADTVVQPGATYSLPPIPIKPALGKEQVTLYCSDKEFAPGELLRGKSLGDRVFHRFYGLSRQGGRVAMHDDAARMVKKTIDIETR